MTNYWNRRLTRRRAIAATGGLSAAAAILAACGSGGGSGGKVEDASSLVAPFTDNSKAATKGGVFSSYVGNDEITLDPVSTGRGSGFGGPLHVAYSRLIREKEAPGGTKSAEFVSDLAESWELSDGGTKLVAKLRPNAKFDPRAPTNGRALDADDVVFTWKRLVAIGSFASQLYNGADPSSPVTSVEKVDDKTIVFKLAFPSVSLLPTLASGVFMVLPKEAESQSTLDLRNTVRGSGPWMLDKYTPSGQFEWRRNPNYFRSDQPFMDGYNDKIITEIATQISAFRSKQLDWFLPTRSEDVLPMSRELSGVKLYQRPFGPNTHQLLFGSRPDSPFKDVRVRRAASMAMDRDLYADVDTNASMFAAAGIPYDIAIDSHLSAAYKGVGLWLDPKGKDLGEGAQYFQHNVAEAKKLLTAAGFANGLETPLQFRNSPEQQKDAEKTAAMMTEGGFKPKLQPADYQTVYLPVIYTPPADKKGDYDGYSIGGSKVDQPDPMTYIYARLHTRGTFTGARAWDAESKATDTLIEKARQEFDENKRKALIGDLQKQFAMNQNTVSFGCGYRIFELAWPWVQNWGYQASWNNYMSQYSYENVWIDNTKRV